MEENQPILSLMRQFAIPLGLSIVALTFISAGIYYTVKTSSKNSVEFIENQSPTASSSATIIVHIAGGVVSPGMYEFPLGTRVGEAIEKAGGLSDEADNTLVNKALNYAQVLTDGAKIYIPLTADKTNTIEGDSFSILSIANIHINSSSKEELMSLSGIGEVRAQKIIDNRPFSSIDELVDQKIIPLSIFEDIKDQISL